MVSIAPSGVQKLFCTIAGSRDISKSHSFELSGGGGGKRVYLKGRNKYLYIKGRGQTFLHCGGDTYCNTSHKGGQSKHSFEQSE